MSTVPTTVAPFLTLNLYPEALGTRTQKIELEISAKVDPQAGLEIKVEFGTAGVVTLQAGP